MLRLRAGWLLILVKTAARVWSNAAAAVPGAGVKPHRRSDLDRRAAHLTAPPSVTWGKGVVRGRFRPERQRPKLYILSDPDARVIVVSIGIGWRVSGGAPRGGAVCEAAHEKRTKTRCGLVVTVGDDPKQLHLN